MNSRFFIINTPLTNVVVLQRKVICDERGYIERMYCIDDLADVVGKRRVVQINHTMNHKAGTVRGMHFQRQPHAECKIVSCLRGEIFDVAVDVRHNSPTFLHWHGEILSETNRRMLVIPEGFAHGFQALVDGCELLYFSTAPYKPEAEAAINAEDPYVGIRWPMSITMMSEKDCAHRCLTAEYQGELYGDIV